MLQKTKLAMHIATTVFDSEILDLIAAAIADIRHCGPKFDASEVLANDGTVTDYQIDDPLVSRAVITYCRMMFGSPADFDRLKASYEAQKGQLRESSAYGMEAL